MSQRSVLFITFLFVFVATAFITLWGLLVQWGLIDGPRDIIMPHFNKLLSLTVIQVVGVVVITYRSQQTRDERKAVKSLMEFMNLTIIKDSKYQLSYLSLGKRPWSQRELMVLEQVYPRADLGLRIKEKDGIEKGFVVWEAVSKSYGIARNLTEGNEFYYVDSTVKRDVRIGCVVAVPLKNEGKVYGALALDSEGALEALNPSAEIIMNNLNVLGKAISQVVS